MKSDLEEVEVQLIHETKPESEDEGAYLVTDGSVDKDKKLIRVWMPKSACQLEKNGKSWTLTAPERTLVDKGLL